MQARRSENPSEPFAALPPALAEQLAARATTRRYRRGDYVCHAGDAATRMFVVQSGRIAIAVRSRDGRESVPAVLGPRSLFGELPFFDGEPRSSDVRALTPVVLWEIDYEDVRAVVDDQPSLAWAVTLILPRR